jgi:hypothetical protein
MFTQENAAFRLELEAPWKAKKAEKASKSKQKKKAELAEFSLQVGQELRLIGEDIKMYDGYIVVKDAQTNSFRIDDKYSNVTAGKAKFA